VSYPGNLRHQALLGAIDSFYRGDARVRAVLLFGSLARGNWDDLSDIDLDVILADGVALDPVQELCQLCAAFLPLGERPALIILDGVDAGDVILESLAQLSVRYHALDTTNPNILHDMLLLTGNLDEATIRAAGECNRKPADSAGTLQSWLDRCIYYLPVAVVALQRGHFWDTLEILQRIRKIMLEIYAYSRGSYRAYQFFDRQAPAGVSDMLKTTLPLATLGSLRTALLQTLDILEFNLDLWSNGELNLSDGQRKIIARVRQSL
jgi:hypothetical protein